MYLEKTDFISPLLYNIYKYMCIISKGDDISKTTNIKDFLNNYQLKILIDKLYEYDNEFINDVENGIYKSGYFREGEMILSLPEYDYSIIQKYKNKFDKIMSNNIIDGELNALDKTLYKLSIDTIHIDDHDAYQLGRGYFSYTDENYNIRPLHDQIGEDGILIKGQYELFNELFLGIGNKLIERKKKLLTIFFDNIGKNDNKNFPNKEISKFIF